MNNNYIKVRIEGKNINNYLKWLIKQKMNIINLNVITPNRLEIIINKTNYPILTKYSKTYTIVILKKYGKLRVAEIIKNNSYIFTSLIIAVLFLYFLSNIIFSIDVFYNDQTVVKQIKNELKKYGIEKYRLKKDYTYLNKVKNQILTENKDTLEWLEIVENGTQYIIKLVERKKAGTKNQFQYQSITTTKNAIITSIKAMSGEKIKDVNDYVQKDEIIVSGILKKTDGTLIYEKADALVYGEVWYKIKTEYPYAYSEEKLTGESKDVFVINFLSKKIPVFTYQKFKNFKIKTFNTIIENNILPISLSKEKQYEVIVTEDIYTLEEVISNSIEISKRKLLESNNKILKINKVEVLNKKTMGSKVYLELFVSVIEDITKVIEIKKEEETEKDLQN